MGYERGGGNMNRRGGGNWNSPGRGRGGFRGGNRGSSPGFRGGNRGGGSENRNFRGNSFNRDGNRSFGRDGPNRSFSGGDNGGRPFGGRGGGFRGGRGGNFQRGGGNFNRNVSFGQNGTPQNRKRRFDDASEDNERPDFKKSNLETSFFNTDGSDGLKNKTPSILKKDGFQNEKKNVKLFSDKKSPIPAKTPSTPHPTKLQKGKIQPRKVVESDSEEEDNDVSGEDSDDIELYDLKSTSKKPIVDDEEDEEVEVEDEDFESDEEEDEVISPAPPKAAPKPGKANPKFSLDAISHERALRVEVLSRGLFSPTDKKLNSIQVFRKVHPFVVDVWTVPTGTLILFDSVDAKNAAHKYLLKDKRFKLENAQDVAGLLEESVKNVDPLTIKVSHVPSGCSQNDLKVVFPDANNVKLNGDWATLSFASHGEAVKAVSAVKNIKIYGKPVLVAFQRGLNPEETQSNGIEKKDRKDPVPTKKTSAVEALIDEASENEAEDEELAEDLEAEDQEVEDEDGENDDQEGDGLIHSMAAEDGDSDDIPSSEEGIEEVTDEEDDE